MGSANIRQLLEEEVFGPDFSISGPPKHNAPPVRDRIKQLVGNFGKEIDKTSAEERERVLQQADLYTKKARFSSNVHFVDKKTDKVVFIDTGTSIALRRTGINEAGVALALQMAQDRFGSTLTINGSAEFKHLVIEAAAKNNMDIHFTDKGMNEQLTARRESLALERDGHKIEQPAAPDQAGTVTSAEVVQLPLKEATPAASPQLAPKPVVLEVSPEAIREAAKKWDEPDFANDYREKAWDDFKAPQQVLNAIEVAAVGVRSERAQDPSASSVEKQQIGERDAKFTGYLHAAGSTSDIAMTAIAKNWDDPSYKEAFKEQVWNQASQVQGTTSADANQGRYEPVAVFNAVEVAAVAVRSERVQDPSTSGAEKVHLAERDAKATAYLHGGGAIAEKAIATIAKNWADPIYKEAFEKQATSQVAEVNAQRSTGDPAGLYDAKNVLDLVQAAASQIQRSVPASAPEPLKFTHNGKPAVLNLDGQRQPEKMVIGTLVDHGAAPYKHGIDNETSYYVTLKTNAGPKTLWGNGLKDLMQARQPVQGERIELRDMGTTPVQVPHRAVDGTVSMINAERREWQMDALDQDGPATTEQNMTVVDIEESHEREID